MWVERLSWLVAIVGIPSLLIGLVAITRRPHIAVGLTPLQKRRRLLRRTIELPASEISLHAAGLFNVQFAITNIGRATARELLVNYIFPGLNADQLTIAQGAPAIQSHPLHGKPFWVLKIDHIHPEDTSYQVLAVHVPVTTPAIDIEYEVSMADAPTRRGSLRVKLG
jgi:hypothetical protein